MKIAVLQDFPAERVPPVRGRAAMPTMAKGRAGRSGVATGVPIETDARFRVSNIALVKPANLPGPSGPDRKIPAQETAGARGIRPQAPD